MKASNEIRVKMPRCEWNPFDRYDRLFLMRDGCEVISDVTFIRLVRWNKKRRAYDLEALARPDSLIVQLVDQKNRVLRLNR